MMRKFVAILVISSIVLSGCSRLRDSRLNPGNWFGGSKPEPVATAPGEVNPLIPQRSRLSIRDRRKPVYVGTPVDQITKVTVEPTTAGAIIHVTGISLQQGAFDARLVSDNDGEPVGGVLVYRLMAVQPRDTLQGHPRQRTIHTGRFVSNHDLAATKTIRIIGARNELTKSN